MDARVGHEVVLELAEVDVEGALEPERRRDRRDRLGDDPVEVRVRRTVHLSPTT